MRQFLLYAAVGASGTVVHYAILIAGVSLGLGPVWASTIGAIGGAIANYFLNHRLTFKSDARHLSSAPKFFAVAAAGAGVNWLAMTSLTSWTGMHYLAAQLISTAIVLALSFTINRAWSFRNEQA